MATQKDIRTRITSVQKTQKITRAMKVVSAAKLSRAQHAIISARPYATKLKEVLAAVSAGVDPEAHALLAPREQIRKLDILVFTSDRGLCGAFNMHVIKQAERLIAERRHGLDEINILGIGRRGAEHFARRTSLARRWTELGTPSVDTAAEIAAEITRRYLEEEADQVALVYGQFQSAMTQVPCAEYLLPFSSDEEGGGDSEAASYEVEPSPEALLGLLLPRAVEFGIFRALLETAASEHGARMSAMDSATSNCSELIDSLTLDMNKARQSAITQELSEIVGGAEAL
jgi:F-type H+-transporting ATPase subunit gamma